MREGVLALARADARISGGAVTGSAAVGAEDRWSDVDLSFGVADGVDPEAVLADWTRRLEVDLRVLHHWDLRRGPTIYRVFLLPGTLELDGAVTPALYALNARAAIAWEAVAGRVLDQRAARRGAHDRLSPPPRTARARSRRRPAPERSRPSSSCQKSLK